MASWYAAFSVTGFQDRAGELFRRIQAAWSAQRWELARPWLTDHLYQTQRYWLDRYQRHGLANRLDQLRGVGDTAPPGPSTPA